MKYKSILLDVDGTLVPVGPHTIPSDKVIESLRKAKDKVHVSVVSGRPINWLTDIFKVLDLTDPCIINGGSQIIDPKTQEILWERPLNKEDVAKILKMIEKDNIPFLVNDNGVEYKNPLNHEFEKPLALQLTYFNSKKSSDQYLEALHALPGVTAHKFFSWGKNREYTMEIYITHKEASKSHAAEELARILHIQTSEMIGVGDARNDIPLLGVCGLKVAMGNADNKLKKIADYVAPSISEDGVCDVVNTYIINESDIEQLRNIKKLAPNFFKTFIDFFR